MLQRDVRDGIDNVSICARADREDRARPVPRTDEDMVGPARTVDEVPRLQRTFLALDEEESLAVQDEEVFLLVLAVVPAGRLAGLEHTDVDAELREVDVAFEACERAEDSFQPARLARVEDEPAVTLGR